MGERRLTGAQFDVLRRIAQGDRLVVQQAREYGRVRLRIAWLDSDERAVPFDLARRLTERGLIVMKRGPRGLSYYALTTDGGLAVSRPRARAKRAPRPGERT